MTNAEALTDLHGRMIAAEIEWLKSRGWTSNGDGMFAMPTFEEYDYDIDHAVEYQKAKDAWRAPMFFNVDSVNVTTRVTYARDIIGALTEDEFMQATSYRSIHPCRRWSHRFWYFRNDIGACGNCGHVVTSHLPHVAATANFGV